MIGTKIFYFRKKRGLSLSELSGKARVSKSYLSNIERNLNQNPSIQILEKIAAVLKVDLKALIEIDTKQVETLEISEEWIVFIQELESIGINKEQIKEYRTLIEFIKWQKEKGL